MAEVSYIKQVRSKFMKWLLPFTDKEYSSLITNQNFNNIQYKFIEVYENVYLMEGLSLLIAIPAIFYTRKVIRYKAHLIRCDPNYNVKEYQNLKRKMILFLSFGSAIVINSQLYAYKNDLYGLEKLTNTKQQKNQIS